MPDSLEALAKFAGLASSNFCFASFDRPLIILKFVVFGIGVFSFFCSFFISFSCLFTYPSYLISDSIWSIVFWGKFFL
jgi:hypothetical protein